MAISNNLAIVEICDGKFYLKSSLRYFDRNEIISIEKKMETLASAFGAELIRSNGYPNWQPDFENKFLHLVQKLYKQESKKAVGVKAIHAGLECGVLIDKLGRIDAISIGPNLKAVHSPTESMEIATASKFWGLFIKILAKL